MPMAVVVAMLVLVVVATAAVMGAAMIASGWRGRAVDRHPRCRACRFDLVGHARRPSQCPECGATLLGCGCIRLGRRRPRWSRIAAGALVLAFAAAPIVILLLPARAPVGANRAFLPRVAVAAPVPRLVRRTPVALPMPAVTRHGDVPRAGVIVPNGPRASALGWQAPVQAMGQWLPAFTPDYGQFGHVERPAQLRPAAPVRAERRLLARIDSPLTAPAMPDPIAPMTGR